MSNSDTADESTNLLSNADSHLADPNSSRYLDLQHYENLHKIDTLAAAKYRSGNFEESEDLLRQALTARKKLLGPEHPDTLLTSSNLAASLGRLGKYEEAEDLFKKALSGREKIHGVNNVDVLTTVNHLAVLYKQRGRFSDSERMFDRALEGLSQELGPTHLLTAETAYNFATLRVQQGLRKKAGILFAQAHKGLSGTLGPEHQHTLDALYWEIKCAKDYEGLPTEGHDKLFISRKQWKQSDKCELCEMTFTMIKRQHHCRICSRSVCHECSSSNTMVLEFDANKPVRFCAVCEQQGF